MAADIQRLIDSILASERMRSSSHFSKTVYGDEPILTTGRQMSSYLPERYLKMRAISRWQDDPTGQGHGRWLSEAELFFRQGLFMADWEDDCPYHGSFKSYYPTYNAMSDRQLRGYFTWRAAVRAGDVRQSSASFAFVYLYELLCGIGVPDPAEGFRRIESFWKAYRAFAPELDRYVPVWLQDYAVYHGLAPELLKDSDAVRRDRSVAELSAALDAARAAALDAEATGATRRGGGRRRAGSGTPPLGDAVEERLIRAIDALSSYRIMSSRFYRDRTADMRHVACAVFLRLGAYYDRHRKLGLVESLFGKQSALAYTMFASAVFFDPVRHPDADYELDGVQRYSCRGGMWTCTRLHGSDERSHELGRALRTVDRRMRDATGYAHPLKIGEVTPKYLSKIIDEEIDARLAWAQAHKPVEVDIDLSKLSGIRRAAAQTREALLVDEEREDGDAFGPEGAADAGPVGDGAASSGQPVGTGPCDGPRGDAAAIHAATDDATDAVPKAPVCEARAPEAAATAPAPPSERVPGGALSPAQAAYVRALLAGDAAAAADAARGAAVSEDMLVDAVNEALFDQLGDTAVEFGPDGPRVIDDYREDVEEILNHG